MVFIYVCMCVGMCICMFGLGFSCFGGCVCVVGLFYIMKGCILGFTVMCGVE